MPERTNIVKTYRSMPLNENKRHFVFGDIHGRYATFQGLLDLINYDATTDVIYSVGDMIDRGPDSVSVVEFFQQAHCYAVLGNHEQMVLNTLEWEAIWMDPRTGGPATVRSLDRHGRSINWLAEIFTGLPICLDVGDETQTASFRLIHAESPFGWSESKLMSYLSSVTRYEAAEGQLLWGRTDISSILRSREVSATGNIVSVADFRSPRAVYCGHTPIYEVVSAFNVHWLDTFAGGMMTCINPMTMEIHQFAIDTRDR